MGRKAALDGFGVFALVGFAALMGFNQVVVKVTNAGIQPVAGAGLRSALAIMCLGVFVLWRGQGAGMRRADLGAGLLIGLLFSVEFMLLFLALDLTTVTRVSVIFYTMPVWLAFAGHFLLPGEALTGRRLLGFALAILGVATAFADRASGGGQARLLGDALALGAALCWAGIALSARLSRLRHARPVAQLLWQLLVSAALLLLVAPLFGPLLRDPQPVHWAGLGFQAAGVAFAGFLLWFWILSIYPAGAVASFGFLAPVFGVAFGWLLLGEEVGPLLGVALLLVVLGMWLINRPRSKATSALQDRGAAR